MLAAVVPLPHSGALHSRPMNTCETYLPSSREDLHALAAAIGHVDETVVRHARGVHRLHELRRRLVVGVGRRRIGRVVGRHVSERAPHPLELAGVGIEDDDAAVAVAVGDEQLVRLRMDERVGGLIQVLRVGVALALAPRGRSA